MTNIKTIIYVLIAAIICGLVYTSCSFNRKCNKLQDELSSAIINIKAYENENSELKTKNIEFEYTVDQLNASKDSINQKLNSVRKQLKVKDKELSELAYIASQTNKVDSIFVRDTCFVKDFQLDTTVFDQYSKLHLNLEYPNKIAADYSFKNEMVLVTNSKKETIKPAKKCALFRLFQKKQIVLETTVVEENPYCEIKEQRFVNIIK